jgi:hypothetical protein
MDVPVLPNRRLDLTEQIENGFLQLASLSDDRINLAHGALLIAKAAYPDLDESLYLARLDRLASDVKRNLTADIDAATIIARINHILFDDSLGPKLQRFKVKVDLIRQEFYYVHFYIILILLQTS